MDYYSILGINRNATPEEIKKAYRRLAMANHPDRGGDEAKFKQITEAYEILSNSDKRSAYDNPQQQWQANNNPPNFDDIFGTFFGNGFSQQRRQPQGNRDITIAAKITLADVLQGKSLIAAYRLNSGREESVHINIPPGANHGDTINYQGLGDDSNHKFPRGNLYVKIQVEKHTDWVRDNLDLITKRAVNVLDLLLGTTIQIKTLDNKDLSVNIPKGTNPGANFSIRGYGIPHIKNGKKGNIYIHIGAVVPKIDNQDYIEKIQEIKNGIS
jgi:curved DNA-binding protein